MTGERPRRRWRIELQVEGDTWEDAGRAFARALAILQVGRPEEIPENPPFHVGIEVGTAELRLEASQDPKMTPEAYAELRAAYEDARVHESPSTD